MCAIFVKDSTHAAHMENKNIPLESLTLAKGVFYLE